MNKLLITLSSAAFLILAGCEATTPAKVETVAPTAEAAKPSLTDEAKAALAQAQADVKNAHNKKALWTTAADELKKAEAAAAEFDSKAVIKHAKTASNYVKMGIEQTQYPLTTVPAPAPGK